MKIDELFTRLRSADVILDLDGDELCVNAPSGAIDAELKGLLTRNKTAIIDALRQAKRASTLNAPRMDPLPPGRDLPASFAQVRLWFFD